MIRHFELLGSGRQPPPVVQLTKTIRCTSGEEKNFVDINAVKDVIGNPKFKDHYTVVYTIAGPSRTGKSFLLNLFWNFLQNRDQTIDYKLWFRAVGKVERIFEWKRGVKSFTLGIHILKEPIVLSHNGKKVALFLADTQGIFDHRTSQRNQTFLGTFSFLISSFIIFNVQNRIETTHLDAIYKSATNLKDTDGFYMMQKQSLMFVVRDSDGAGDDDDDTYGMEGGKRYFKTLIQEDNPNRAVEHQMMHEYMEFAFGDNIPCCLLPHPGDAVKSTTCSAADLNDDFQREIIKLFQEMKKGCKINIKTIRRKQFKCGELYEAIKDYVFRFGSDLDIDENSSFCLNDFRAQVITHLKNEADKFLKLLSNQEIWKGSNETIVKNLEKIKRKLLSNFKQKIVGFYPQRIGNKSCQELDRVLSQLIKNIKICLHVDEVYKRAILEYNKWLNINARQHLEQASNFTFLAREVRDTLLQEMNEIIYEHEEETENLREIVKQCKEYFFNHTNKLTAGVDEDIQDFLKVMGMIRHGINFVKTLNFVPIILAFFPAFGPVASAITTGGLFVTEALLQGGGFIAEDIYCNRIRKK